MVHSRAHKADQRREVLASRARYLRDKAIPSAGTTKVRDLRLTELAAIRWCLRIIDADWDLALEVIHRAEDADLDPEEDQ